MTAAYPDRLIEKLVLQTIEPLSNGRCGPKPANHKRCRAVQWFASRRGFHLGFVSEFLPKLLTLDLAAGIIRLN